jgi:broad specificity phosphatase PhoE
VNNRLLILVRHSAVTVDPKRPAQEWRLSDEGKRRARALAQKLSPYRPSAIISSHETKAQETAAIIASTQNLPLATAANLHEHVRHTFIADPVEWDAAVAAFFAQPDQLVLGTETAEQAQKRIVKAIDEVLRKHPEGNLIIVTHGTVLTLFLAKHDIALDPFTTWKSLEMPCHFVLGMNSQADTESTLQRTDGLL